MVAIERRQSSSSLKAITKKLEVALAEAYEASSEIKRIEGGQIGIPDFMTVQEAIDALTKYLRLREKQEEKTLAMECHPDDGLIAFRDAIRNKFGMLLGSSIQTWFYRIPSERVVTVGFEETETVPYGELSIPGLPSVTMQIDARYNPKEPLKGNVSVYVTYKRKYRPLIDEIENLWREELTKNSIFKGKAINSFFEFIDLKGADTSKIIYTDDELRQLEANVFTPLRYTNSMLEQGVPLKRTVLLHGPFGTGKTFTALKTAQEAVENGWTFMSVRTGDNIAPAIRFARKFQPAVVFFEDVDVETGGERSTAMNEVLNTIDGVLSKNSQVLTLLTTNNLDRINKAMLRPGRIDSLIRLGEMTEQSVSDLIHAYAGSHLEGELDTRAAYEVAKEYVPAFVANAVERAQAYSISRNGGKGGVNFTSDDVVAALKELRPQLEVMLAAQVVDQLPLDQVMRQTVVDGIIEFNDGR